MGLSSVVGATRSDVGACPGVRGCVPAFGPVQGLERNSSYAPACQRQRIWTSAACCPPYGCAETWYSTVMDDDQQIEVAAPVHSRHQADLSFDGFFRREYRQVLGLAFVLSGSRWAAEELTMDAFEAALTNWSQVSQLDSPGAWVRKVVSNASVSRFRRQAAERRAKARMTGDARLWQLESSGDPDVWEAVRGLSRRQAQVVALFYVDGYQRREIAGVLGISEEAVKTHLERGRSRLRRALGDRDEV